MNIFVKLIAKYTSRKWTVALIPWLYIAAMWKSTGTPPDKLIVIVAILASTVFTLVEGYLDRLKFKTLPNIGIILILASLVAPGTVFAQTAPNAGHLTLMSCENVSPAASQGLDCPVILAQDPEIGEEAATEGCCPTLAECQRALVAATNDPPDIPLGGLLSSFPWYRNLPPWAKVTISGVSSALLVGATV